MFSFTCYKAMISLSFYPFIDPCGPVIRSGFRYVMGYNLDPNIGHSTSSLRSKGSIIPQKVITVSLFFPNDYSQ